MNQRIEARQSWRQFTDPLILFVVLVALWQKSVTWFSIEAYLLPAPVKVLESIWVNWQNILLQTWITAQEVLAAFVLSAIAGVALGVLIFLLGSFRRTIYPFIVVFQGLPKIALAPLIIVWFGYGPSSKIIMAFMFAFFPVVISTMGGLAATPSNLIEHFRAIHASPWFAFRRLYVPSALPSIMDGLKQAMPLTVIGAIVGEFVGSMEGLGHLIMITTANARTDYMFAALVAVSILAAVLYLIIEIVAKRVWWRGL